ncbi:MAG: hypothetical protein ACT4RN_14050 [Pseudonocardia sp.]
MGLVAGLAVVLLAGAGGTAQAAVEGSVVNPSTSVRDEPRFNARVVFTLNRGEKVTVECLHRHFAQAGNPNAGSAVLHRISSVRGSGYVYQGAVRPVENAECPGSPTYG